MNLSYVTLQPCNYEHLAETYYLQLLHIEVNK